MSRSEAARCEQAQRDNVVASFVSLALPPAANLQKPQKREKIPMEILSPAGSQEAMRAAVCAGADAVYLGFGQFNARRGAKNFTRDEFASAVSYCHLRGVKVYLTLNTLCSDREMAAAVDCAVQASRLGADAALVQDMGLVRALRQAAPTCPFTPPLRCPCTAWTGCARRPSWA